MNARASPRPARRRSRARRGSTPAARSAATSATTSAAAALSEHDVADRALLAGEHAPCDRRRCRPRRRPRALPRSARAMPRSSGSSTERVHLAVASSCTRGDVGGGELVEPVVAEEHHRALGAELGAACRASASAIAGSDTPTAWRRTPRRVGERAEEVERGGHAELACAAGPSEAHRRVEPRREAEPDAGLVDAARDAVRAEVDRDAERLEHVGRAALRRRGPVAVLRDPRARARRDERGHRRDVDGARAVAAGAAGVDQRAGRRPSTCVGEREHRAHERGELAGGLALRAQRDDERRRSARR